MRLLWRRGAIVVHVLLVPAFVLGAVLGLGSGAYLGASRPVDAPPASASAALPRYPLSLDVSWDVTERLLLRDDEVSHVSELQRFRNEPDGSYSSVLLGVLKKNPDGTWTLRGRDGSRKTFDSKGRPHTIEDRDGCRGEADYAGGEVVKIVRWTRPSGWSTYEFDAVGNVTKITTPR